MLCPGSIFKPIQSVWLKWSAVSIYLWITGAAPLIIDPNRYINLNIWHLKCFNFAFYLHCGCKWHCEAVKRLSVLQNSVVHMFDPLWSFIQFRQWPSYRFSKHPGINSRMFWKFIWGSLWLLIRIDTSILIYDILNVLILRFMFTVAGVCALLRP